MIKIASWNVNGIRACFKNEAGIKAFVKKENPDLLCLSEVKCNEQDNPLVMSLEGYSVYWNASKVKKGGYSGTA